jgi:hypothetical protein
VKPVATLSTSQKAAEDEGLSKNRTPSLVIGAVEIQSLTNKAGESLRERDGFVSKTFALQ